MVAAGAESAVLDWIVAYNAVGQRASQVRRTCDRADALGPQQNVPGDVIEST
jgi:hypothetical protein